MSTTTRYATIEGRDYRVLITDYSVVSSTVVQVRVVFSGDNGAVWRALPWWAEKRTAEVLRVAR